jgi:hypothetical protein
MAVTDSPSTAATRYHTSRRPRKLNVGIIRRWVFDVIAHTFVDGVLIPSAILRPLGGTARTIP